MENLLALIPTGSQLVTSAEALGLFIIVLSILVFVHELGHYLAARSVGIKVDQFSIGFGPEIFGWTRKNGERWKVCWVPLGGFVKMHGMIDDPEQAEGDDPHAADAYYNKPVWARMWAVFAGPFANFLFAWVALSFLFFGGEERLLPEIGDVMDGMPAAEAGLQPGDRILSVNGVDVADWDAMRIGIQNSFDQVDLTVQRTAEIVQLTIRPEIQDTEDVFGTPQRVGRVGIMPSMETTRITYDWYLVPFIAAEKTWEMTYSTIRGIGAMLTGRVSADNLGGPILIADMAQQTASHGMYHLIIFMVIISINLGLLNLLPIPVLDGGHLLFLTLEAIFRRPVPEKLQEYAYRLGLFLIIGLMGFAMFNDLARVVGKLGAS